MADTIDIARWYCVSRQGMATLCLDEADARNAVVECDADWPLNAPHRAVLMGDVAAMRAENDRLRSEMEAVKADAGRYRWLRAQPATAYAPPIDVLSWSTLDESADTGESIRLEELDAAIDAAMNDRKEG